MPAKVTKSEILKVHGENSLLCIELDNGYHYTFNKYQFPNTSLEDAKIIFEQNIGYMDITNIIKKIKSGELIYV